ncbi:MAG: matrixin family metalloprotease [Phormidesmis sp.]
MAITSPAKSSATRLKNVQLSTNLLEKVEGARSRFSQTAIQDRLDALTERLQSIEVPDGQRGRQLAGEIQSTIKGFTNSVNLMTEMMGPQFSSGQTNRLDPYRGTGRIDPTQASFCACSICAKTGDDGRTGSAQKPAGFNTVGNDNDEFGRNYGKWAQPGGRGTAVDITYSFKKDWDVPGLSISKAKSLFKEALQVWADYAPLNFREINDPGNGDLVDIQVGDQYRDGPFGTLAFAYFPKNGDITFDSGETWREPLFLETAVHEIGHSLGLGHENGTSAIMNSSIQNRYSDEAFLLQDDINGIRSIYGSGKGSVRSLGQSPAPTTPAPEPTPAPTPAPEPTPNPNKNLVINGSFENSSVGNNQFRIFNQINGWKTYDGSGIQIERRNQFGGAADGKAWVELDSNSNSTMYQQVDTLLGEDYTLSFKYSPRQRLSAETNKIRVYWGDRWIDTITKAGGNKNQWDTFSYDVKGKDDKSLLAFRAVGTNDKVGGFIDDVVVTKGAAAQSATAGDPFESDRSASALFATADTTLAGSTAVL